MQLPKVTIIVPEKNEAQVIEKCVSSILSSNYPKEKLELLVVCNGCSDDTEGILKKHKGKFRLIKTGPKRSKGQVLNFALKKSGGEIIGIFDADTILEKGCISEAVKNFSKKEVTGVAGTIKSSNRNENLLTRMTSVEIIISNLVENIFSSFGKNAYFQGKNMFIRKSCLEKLGGFRGDIPSEDFEISSKMCKAGMKTIFEKKSVAWQQEPNNTRSYLKQRYRWSFGGVALTLGEKSIFNPTDLIHGFPYYFSFLGFLSYIFIFLFLILKSAAFFSAGIFLFSILIMIATFSKIQAKEPVYDILLTPIFFILGSIYIFLIPKSYINSLTKKSFKWFTPKRSSYMG